MHIHMYECLCTYVRIYIYCWKFKTILLKFNKEKPIFIPLNGIKP